jgi:hypothetical protein
MKKIGSMMLSVAILAITVLSLFSCTGGGDAPEGMQLVAGGERLGYYFYAPDEWTVSNIGRIKSAYVSRVDTTSVSFTEVAPKDFLPDGKESADEYFFNSYFADSLKEFKGEPKVANPDGENIIFGKEGESADKAKKYTYTYEYFDYTANKTFNIGFMQILLRKGESYYIFTYSASMETRNGADRSYYDFYLGSGDGKSKIDKVINNFRFVTRVEGEDKKEPTVDADGYILISDAALSGFKLYAPSDFTSDYSSAIVSATHSDGSNINMSEANGTNEDVNSYMLRKFGELESIIDGTVSYEVKKNEAGETEYASDGKTAIVNYTSIKFGNAEAANAYEYSYVYRGETYRVYQVIIIDGWTLSYRGYVFTYTAKDANYALHFDDIMKTVDKARFE